MAQEAQKWPVFAWYLYDEPDVHGKSRAYIENLNSYTKVYFPNHKTAFVIGQAKTKENYYGAADILMLDWYPVPHMPLESLGEHIAVAKEGLDAADNKKTELIAVVQTFDWRTFKQFRPDTRRIGRYPSKEEIRFMSYHSIINGARGLFYFYYPQAAATEERWGELAEVVWEIKSLGDVFKKGKQVKTPAFIPASLSNAVWKYKGAKYLVIASTEHKDVWLPAELNKKKYKLIYDGGAAEKDKIAPYGVFIFKY
ncbi:hypothetical protein Dip510_001850 [Elusimicrobium posterum]|uniref:hypothetical protein n=1 Tax=Elusimicrobium posterum TaxID=3116653 RepID=UPI003C76E300